MALQSKEVNDNSTTFAEKLKALGTGLTFMTTFFLGTKVYNALNPELDYFNWITENVILGSIPIGDKDRDKIIAACEKRGKKLGFVVQVVDLDELKYSCKNWGEFEVVECHIQMRDFTAHVNEDALVTACDTIKQKLEADPGAVIYIHCKAGKSRSVVITMIILMSKYGLNFDEAEFLVKYSRPQVGPSAKKMDIVKRVATKDEKDNNDEMQPQYAEAKQTLGNLIQKINATIIQLRKDIKTVGKQNICKKGKYNIFGAPFRKEMNAICEFFQKMKKLPCITEIWLSRFILPKFLEKIQTYVALSAPSSDIHQDVRKMDQRMLMQH